MTKPLNTRRNGERRGTHLPAVDQRGSSVAVILPDVHAGFEDRLTIDNVLEYVRDANPGALVQLGDMVDFYGISRFDKEPDRIDTVQSELNVAHHLWERFKDAAPHAKYYQLEGNHEHRLYKTLLANPGLFSLDALRPEKLFRLDELGVHWVPAEKTLKLNNSLVVTHGAVDDGCKMSQHSAYSARSNLEKWGVSGISGHTHRVGSHYRTLADRVLAWHEIGCLCRLDPGYVKYPNWQQGFATVYHTSNRFHVVVTAITSHQFIANGRKYG